MNRHILLKISPNPSLPVHDRKKITKEGDNNFPLWQRGNKGDFVNCRSSSNTNAIIRYAPPTHPSPSRGERINVRGQMSSRLLFHYLCEHQYYLNKTLDITESNCRGEKYHDSRVFWSRFRRNMENY